ncbi:proteinase inhibitor I2 Kunitz metazoa [Echinococcus multilocularis]|uniref:Proteinase inhibitor I2 Kunitz metazoa n=1 Tax=Echinococcus multilocularis TaxID=6211 RepID=A0A068YK06_ECHMU|nr:proteinase inhibitor I2 Kunitz metazoa [Echinococcus multilocularis]
MTKLLLLALMLLCVVCLSQGRADICNLKIERGNCQSHIKVYGYNRKKGHCEHFIYSGCGGNANRFNDRSECKRVCGNP